MSKRQPRDRWHIVMDHSLGERGVQTRCAISHALQDLYPSIRRPWVTAETISFSDADTGERMTWVWPKFVSVWINKFDKGRHPAPKALILLKENAAIQDATRNNRVRHLNLATITSDNEVQANTTIAIERSHGRRGPIHRVPKS